MAEEKEEQDGPDTEEVRKEGATAPPKLPTPHEVRTAHKADLVRLCQELGLDRGGKVDELKKRLLDHLATEEAKLVEGEEVKEEPEAAEGVGAETEAKEEEEALEVPEGEEEVTIEEAEAEEGYKAKAKPTLAPEEVRLLHLRNWRNRRRPAFLREESFRYQRVGQKWRRARGIDSKMRRHFLYRPDVPSVGWRGPAAVRNRHPSGFIEVLVYRPEDLAPLDPKRHAARIGGPVGTRKRLAIQAKADDLGVRILNRVVKEEKEEE